MRNALLLLLIAWTWPALANTRVCADPEHHVPADIDAAATPPCTEVWSAQSSPSYVVSSPLGSYRVLGGSYLDRMAYLFRTAPVNDFIRLTITYPDDATSNAEFFTFSEADQSYGMTPLGTGYFTGNPYPITNRLIDPELLLLHAGKPEVRDGGDDVGPGPSCRAGAHQSREGEPRRPAPTWPADASQPGRRKIGMYWEDEVFQQNFSELSVPRMTAASRPRHFRRGLDRHVLLHEADRPQPGDRSRGVVHQRPLPAFRGVRPHSRDQ